MAIEATLNANQVSPLCRSETWVDTKRSNLQLACDGVRYVQRARVAAHVVGAHLASGQYRRHHPFDVSCIIALGSQFPP